MSAFSRIPNDFSFEHKGGQFIAKKSFWQNTLDKSITTFVIELEGFGEYGEVKIPVNTDDWVADAIQAVEEHTRNLAINKFIDNGDSGSETIVEAVTEPPAEELDDFDSIINEKPQGVSELLPFPAIEESEVKTEDEEFDDGDNSEAVEDVDNSQFSEQEEPLSFHVNTDTPHSEKYGFESNQAPKSFLSRPSE